MKAFWTTRGGDVGFAIGVVLMIRFAELAMPHFDSAEIIEMHHNDKPDAPSGTALHTAARLAAALAGTALATAGEDRPARPRIDEIELLRDGQRLEVSFELVGGLTEEAIELHV